MPTIFNKWFTIIFQAVMLILQLLTSVSGLVPAEYQQAVHATIGILQGIQAFLAHYVNPDGTPASTPYIPPAKSDAGSAVKILLIFVLCPAIVIPTLTACKTTASNQVQPTSYSKALGALENVQPSIRAFHDGYMTFFLARVQQIKVDTKMTDKQKATALLAEADRANTVNEIYGKAIGYEQQALTIIKSFNPANFTGSGAKQTLDVINQLANLLTDQTIVTITDSTVLTVLAALKIAIQTTVGILQQQIA